MPEVERLAEVDAELTRLRPGVYVPVSPGAVEARARRELVLARVVAAWSSLDSDVWFSHETAALLHGMWTYRLADRVHLTQLYPPQVRREDDSWDHRFLMSRHWTRLPERDRDEAGGVPVTSLERTAVDCARTLSFESALVVMDCALRHGADRSLVRRIIDESRGKRGVVQARRVLDIADTGAESPGETLTRYGLIEAGLPRPTTQIPVLTSLGPRWVDLGWPAARVGIEFDGEVKYTELADGDPDEVRRRERARQRAIEEEGWRIVRSGWPDIDHPHAFHVRVWRALAGRGKLVLSSDAGAAARRA
ncbi:hypothetical protein M1843_18465 [Isoptericola sp. 4D.3]|uniref:Transcriptional regulator, AbiEi antitoxin, Type IV TA system n=1 Tax=Isoptericola peretonis TaxID=2918523 RepID=A0ABT0J8A5_9MICO|nr:hypothetical protein [Isoptericola sp. 4D.3]